jgi:magnesium-transporting ATPase (P-type)
MQHALAVGRQYQQLVVFAVFERVEHRQLQYAIWTRRICRPRSKHSSRALSPVFASLPVHAPINLDDGPHHDDGLVAGLHRFYTFVSQSVPVLARVDFAFVANSTESSPSSRTSLQQSALIKTVMAYALFNVVMTFEMVTWCIGDLCPGQDFWHHSRHCAVPRVLRAFMATISWYVMHALVIVMVVVVLYCCCCRSLTHPLELSYYTAAACLSVVFSLFSYCLCCKALWWWLVSSLNTKRQ